MNAVWICYIVIFLCWAMYACKAISQWDNKEVWIWIWIQLTGPNQVPKYPPSLCGGARVFQTWLR